MLTHFLPNSDSYSFLYLLSIENAAVNGDNIATFLSDQLSDLEFKAGFDRSLWSLLSSGQMPSELYSFNFYGSDKGCEIKDYSLFILSTEEITAFPDFVTVDASLKLEKPFSISGEMAEPFEVDDEFANCLYVSLLLWNQEINNFPLIDGMQNIYTDGVQIMAGHTLYSVDEWVESYFQADEFPENLAVLNAGYFLFPDEEKMASLAEMLQDKEKVHLDPEIKGIHC